MKRVFQQPARSRQDSRGLRPGKTTSMPTIFIILASLGLVGIVAGVCAVYRRYPWRGDMADYRLDGLSD